jgi:hypothetical protein
VSGRACPPVTTIASESVVGVRVTSQASGGIVSFLLGRPDPDWPAGPPTVEIRAARPPFDRTSSGIPVEVAGQRHLRVHFENMKIYDENGTPSYDGPDRIRPEGGVIRAIVQEEAFEGVVSWIIGYDGLADCGAAFGDDRVSILVGEVAS